MLYVKPLHENIPSPPLLGFFAYTCGCVIVVEDLHSGSQNHWLGHAEEISTLAVSHDAQVEEDSATPGWVWSLSLRAKGMSQTKIPICLFLLVPAAWRPGAMEIQFFRFWSLAVHCAGSVRR